MRKIILLCSLFGLELRRANPAANGGRPNAARTNRDGRNPRNPTANADPAKRECVRCVRNC